MEQRMTDTALISYELTRKARNDDTMYELVGRLVDLVHDFAEHGSVRCSWDEAYGQWRDGDCACGLTEALREAGLPVEWAGRPPADD